MHTLFPSAVRVERLKTSMNAEGVVETKYEQATDTDPALDDMLKFLKCRLDMNFVRPGKDILPAPVAGRAPDRIGIMFTFPYAPIRAGDRLVAIQNEMGKIPVKGVFEIRVIPDEAIDYSDQHHIEVQIIEVGQELGNSNWSTETPLGPAEPDVPDLPDIPEPPVYEPPLD